MFLGLSFDTAIDKHLDNTEDKRMMRFLCKLKGTPLRKLIKSLLPMRIDVRYCARFIRAAAIRYRPGRVQPFRPLQTAE